MKNRKERYEKIQCPYTYDPSNIGCIVCMTGQNVNTCPGFFKRKVDNIQEKGE